MDKFVLSEDDIRRLFHQESEQPQKAANLTPGPKAPNSPRGEAVSHAPDIARKSFPVSPLHTKSAYSPPSQLPDRNPNLPPPSVPPDAYLPAKAKYHSKPQRLIRAAGIFGAAFFISFGALNGGTYTSRLGYWWQTDIVGKEATTTEEIQRITGDNILPTNLPPANASPRPVEQATRLPAIPVTLPPNRIIIPKINVDAPIVWDANPQDILSELQKGVAHYAGTAYPNRQSGNVFFTGHSSGFVWDRSPYTTVFANLDKLVAGDLIAITTDKEEYIYRVKDSVVVRPNETSVLAQTPTPTISLMTCTPVGTNLRRLVVRGDLLRVIPLAETRRDSPL